MFDLLTQGVLYEYSGVVAQLAATSEVTDIGFRMTCPAGDRALFFDIYIAISDLAAAKNFASQKLTTLDASLAYWASITLDNQWTVPGPVITNTANPRGYTQPILLLGAGQDVIFHITDTLDATDTITLQLLYMTRRNPLTVVAIGAGISISAETHVMV